ncbi:MAG: hypothetical protein ACI89L_002685 [Phycisphaerales bacterium]|jgi:hypothetical protein
MGLAFKVFGRIYTKGMIKRLKKNVEAAPSAVLRFLTAAGMVGNLLTEQVL